jgi:hypothetical protein
VTADNIDGGSLSSWLYETYYNVERKAEFTKEDLRQLGDLLSRVMCYLRADRMSTHDILKHEWFVKNSLAEKRGGFIEYNKSEQLPGFK